MVIIIKVRISEEIFEIVDQAGNGDGIEIPVEAGAEGVQLCCADEYTNEFSILYYFNLICWVPIGK